MSVNFRNDAIMMYREGRYSAALETFLVNWFVPCRKGAFRICVASVKYFSATGFTFDHLSVAFGSRTVHAGRERFGILAFGVFRATEKTAAVDRENHHWGTAFITNLTAGRCRDFFKWLGIFT